MKIAISIPQDVFSAIDRLAKERKAPRSEIFTEAAREYLRRIETRQIIQRLNEAWAQPFIQEEAETLRHMQGSFSGRAGEVDIGD